MKEFYYRVASSAETGAGQPLEILFAGEGQTRPGHRIGPKVYDFYLLHHVLSGRGRFTGGGAEHELGAGQSFLIEPEQLVSYEADRADPWAYRWIAFRGPWAAEAAAAFGAGRTVADTGRSRRPAAALRLAMDALRQPAGAQLAAAGGLQLALGEIARACARRDEPGDAPGGAEEDNALVRALLRLLSTQYAEPVTMEGIAESLGYSRAYLSRVFKRHTGATPVSYLLRLRIDKGRLMLRERKDLTIEQIASSVGLQDALYFSRQFRRFYGESPSEYRQSVWGS
ncbi:AraC family transcriptional regulator [Paenibacillus sp. B01]|uniref:AraC family transcriptional regulator n=1 Tax=Paenibacillus sp. B01 TaxID=2660554 RepID=UPI00129AB548|nr:helix-turn-helix domain-containing protein [Paenibacillus sp. B01]QGG57657.1 helix-turn-helix domain-containing protein [Paenibacillus sp. B01]